MAAAAQQPRDAGVLYHLVQQELWDKAKASGQPYKPPTYDADGFIHLTADPSLLLGVANHFYTGTPGTFLVLAIDSAKLTSKVVFEAAAPVGTTEAFKPGAGEAQQQQEEQPLFPHLYGLIDTAAVQRELPVERDATTGAFLSIEGLCS